MKNGAIAVFDSGLGGLSFVREFKKIAPTEKILYVGDTLHLPYGNLSSVEVKRHTKDIFAFLGEQNIKAIVIACNTICSVGMDYFRSLSAHAVFSVIESFAKHAKLSGRVGLMATKLTVEKKVYEKALGDHPNLSITSLACPELVDLVEKGQINSALAKQKISKCLDKLNNPKDIILACTHFSFLNQDFPTNLRLHDPAIHTAKDVYDFVRANDLLGSDTSIPLDKYYVTKEALSFSKHASLFLKKEIKAEQITMNRK